MRERLLTQHVLQRFLENDLLSPDADHHDAIAMVCGGLLTLGLFLSVFISLKFLFMPFPSPGRTAVLAVGDRLVFVTLAMIVLSFVAVAAWDALSLDPRDTGGGDDAFGSRMMSLCHRQPLKSISTTASAKSITGDQEARRSRECSSFTRTNS